MLGLGLSLTGGAVTRGGVSPSLDLDFMAGTMPAAVTFTRASAATYFDSAGVLRTQGYNLLLRSEEFDHAAWSKGASSIQINAGADPFGGNGADKLVENGASAFHYTNQTVVKAANALVYTYSVYIKDAGNGRQVSVTMEAGGSNGASMRVDPATGVITSAALRYGTFTSASGSIASVGNGWHRAMISATTGTEAFIAAQCSLHNGTNSIYQGDGSSGALLWGAMLEQSSTLSGYSPTTSAANGGPRFDHDPVTLAPRGLLVEEARTNLIAGQMSNATYWPAVSVSRGAGVTAPDGSAGTMVTENAGGTAAYGLNSQNVAITAAPITGSIYAKAGTCPWLRVMLADAGAPTTSAHAFFNLLTGEIGISGASGSAGGLPTGISAIIQPVGAGWYRCMLTATLAAHTTASLLLRMVSGNGASSDAGGNTMHFYAPQLEQGAFATSPILSTTTAASRAVDVASITSLAGWFNASSGTLFVEAAIPGLVTNKNILTVSDGTNAEVLQFNTTGGGAVRFSVTDGNVSQAAITSSLTAIPDTAFKAAAAYGPNDFAVSGNGGTVATDASGTLPTVDRIHLAASGTGFSNTSVMFRKIRYWRVRRPNSDLQQITAI